MSTRNLQSSNLPPESELWIFGFSRPLTDSDQARIREKIEAFLPRWQSHGEPVSAAYEIVLDRFVAVAAHCPAGVSGCSIDSSFKVFKELQQEGLDGLNRGLVFYRDRDATVHSVPLGEFQALVDRGEVDAETPVFDTTLRSLKEFRRGAFEVPFSRSWHARSFPLRSEARPS